MDYDKGFSIICAVDKYMGIAKNGTIPWHSPRDLEFFKNITMGHTIIMGKKTWDSLPKKPLPKRDNIVISRYPDRQHIKCHTWEDALAYDNDHKFVIGGREIYTMAIEDPRLLNIYLTYIDHDYDCDLFFPELPQKMTLVEKVDSWSESKIKHTIYKYQNEMSSQYM